MLPSAWLDPAELRIGLGCMRLSTDPDYDVERSRATITAALQDGITVFDTARAYAPGPDQLGHNERLLASVLRDSGRPARVITKGGMTRAGGGWIPDGRAKSILADCEDSLVALDGLEIDLYLLHSPDPRTPWRTSVRTLARLIGDGLVKRVGVSNVNRPQLDEACELAPIAAVELALSLYDDRALRGGMLDRCAEHGLTLIAHSPLGGPGRAAGLGRRSGIARVAEARGVTPQELALAWLLTLSPSVVAIPGARRPETARSAAAAAKLPLSPDELVELSAGASRPRAASAAAKPAATDTEGDLVVVMGIPGAGKSRVATDYVNRGYVRLNRDEFGGSLRDLAEALDDVLSTGSRRVVLDNTYLSRAARSYVIDAAIGHEVPARCVWIDTPLDQAQVNLVERLLDHFGALPTPEQLKAAARSEPGLLMPTSQMRALRELEPPSLDEGFASIERVPFTRSSSSARKHGGGVLIAAGAVASSAFAEAIATLDGNAPHLVFDWRPGGTPDDLAEDVDRLRAEIAGPIDVAVCPHSAGPPACWCRPPLPGLPLAFARAHGLELSRSTVVSASPAHRTLARALGAEYLAPGAGRGASVGRGPP